MTHPDPSSEITDAVLRLIGNRGLDAVTFSTAAAESGFSRGLVQHLFGTRETLLRSAAFRLRHRIDETLHSAARTPPQRLRALLVALVPDSELSVGDAFAATGLLVLARRDDELRETWVRGRALLRSAVEQALRDCGSTTHVSRTASSLLGIAGDLRDAVLIGELDARTAHRRIGRATSAALARTP